MKEDELKREVKEMKSEIKTLRPIVKRKFKEFNQGFQKGKVEQKKEELDYWAVGIENWTYEQLIMCIRERRKQLKKEIGVSVPQKLVQNEEIGGIEE